jgi:hypothetical protein
MEDLPSVWGRHETALIDPMMVRGKLLTSVMDAPDEWNSRLSSLGFRRTNSGWIKLGALKPAEFSYLSSDIDLIGLRAEDIREASENEPDRVPLDVQDMLLRLWQRQTATVMVALSMEHEVTHTRAQAWSFVEAAMAGEITPETETLFGLTLTKLSKSEQGLTPDSTSFADALGWKKPAKTKLLGQSEKLLFNKGESVEWLDSDGVLRAGRLARKVTVNDSGCWVVQGVRWAGGYAYAAPAWVNRTQLYFAHSAQDWSNEKSLAELMPKADSSVYLPKREGDENSISVNSSQTALLSKFLLGHHESFPPVQGLGAMFNKFREHDSWHEDYEQVYSPENLVWLQDLASELWGASEQVYGKSPIGLVLSMAAFEVDGELVREPALTIAVTLGANRLMARSGEFGARVLIDGKLNIGSAAREVESKRYESERLLSTSSNTLAGMAGMADRKVVLASDFHQAAPTFWPKIAEFYEGQIGVEDVIRIQSIMMRGSANAVLRPQSRNLLDAFEGYLYAKPTNMDSFEEAVVSVKDASCTLVDLQDVANTLASSQILNADWINNVPVRHAELYEATVRFPKKAAFDLPAGVSLRPSGSLDQNQPRGLVKTPEEAIERYLTVLDALEPNAEVSSQDSIIQLRKMASQYQVYKRLMEVPAKLAKMPGEELRQRVKAQVYMQEAKKVGAMSESGQDRMIENIAEKLRISNTQGAVCLFSSSRSGFKWRVREVGMDAATLDQTRAATLESAMLKLKNGLRARGVSLLVDGVAIADPELAEILNGDGPAQLKEVVKNEQEGYQDTGVVAGWAMKDIRGMRRIELLDAAEQMSDQQKAKYITRELIWPRKSFEEMKEAGVDLRTAYAYDLLWKALPKSPLTSTREHVNGFISLITGMKEAVEPLLKLPFSSDGTEPEFALAVKSAAMNLWCNELTDQVRQMYRTDVRIRGYSGMLSWNSFAPKDSRRLLTELAGLSWSDVLKSKKKTTAGATGSRVVRGELVREGPDYRGGKSVSGEDFIRTFGFSGVEYGNWTNQAEREKHLNLAYDSMMDFVRVMGWEPMTLSLGGKLGLCIGSRGRGGSRAANAHFEPVNMAINLTRMRGDGALAHEYCHAVANHYGRLATGTPVDMADTFGYVLQKDGAVPSIDKTGLREEVQRAFQNLVVAIMRKPDNDDDYQDISKYTKRSNMLVTSMAKDGATGNYWGSPCEMFARSMEVWFKDRLRDAGERNDYLVRVDKDAGENSVYPDLQHLNRINFFVSPWLDAIKQEVAQVQHPFLGSVEMPILNTELRSVMPLTPALLVELADAELNRLFKACSPNLMLVDDPVYKAGMYDLSRDLLILNAQHADKGTFYHEAWHACHGKLLSSEERHGLSAVFSTEGHLADRVEQLLREKGADSAVIEHMRSDTQEVQAYAFQLWEEGRFAFDQPDQQQGHTFYRVGTFVEGITGVGAYFGQQEAERLFTRFMAGDLAERANMVEGLQAGQGSEWDSDSMLYWDACSVAEEEEMPKKSVLGMR